MDARQLSKLRIPTLFSQGSARFERFSKISSPQKNRAGKVQNFPDSFSSSELSSHQIAVQRSFRQTSNLRPSWTSRERTRRLRSRDSQTRWYSTRAWFGKESFPRAFTKIFRSCTAQCLQQQNDKGRAQLTSTTWQRQDGSGSDGRQSSEDFKEPLSTSIVRHTDSQARG